MPKGEEPNWGYFVGVGLQMAVGVVLGVLIGQWLDNRYGWSPWATLLGAMLGLASGMYLLIKEAIRMNRP